MQIFPRWVLLQSILATSGSCDEKSNKSVQMSGHCARLFDKACIDGGRKNGKWAVSGIVTIGEVGPTKPLRIRWSLVKKEKIVEDIQFTLNIFVCGRKYLNVFIDVKRWVCKRRAFQFSRAHIRKFSQFLPTPEINVRPHLLRFIDAHLSILFNLKGTLAGRQLCVCLSIICFPGNKGEWNDAVFPEQSIKCI